MVRFLIDTNLPRGVTAWAVEDVARDMANYAGAFSKAVQRRRGEGGWEEGGGVRATLCFAPASDVFAELARSVNLQSRYGPDRAPYQCGELLHSFP